MGVTIKQGHVLDVLRTMEPGQFQVCVTSPPYWNLRNYGTPPQIWASEDAPLCAGAHEWADGGRSATELRNGRGSTVVHGGSKGKPLLLNPGTGAFCLRCGATQCELGTEETVELYLLHLIQVFREVWRVLRNDGTCWVNLAGCYFNNPGGQNGGANNGLDYGAGRISAKVMEANRQAGRQDRTGRVPRDYWLKPLDYVDVPGLFAHAMQQAGWLWRSDIAAVKRSPMPESIQGIRWERCRVKVAKNKHCDPLGRGGEQRMLENPEDYRGINPDWLAQWEDCPGCKKCEKNDGYVLRRGNGRPTRAWERLLVFAKRPGAYWDSEAVREPLQQSSLARGYTYVGRPETSQKMLGADDDVRAKGNWRVNGYVPAGRNLRDWIFWPNEGGTKEEHYASYPEGLPRLAIKAGTSEHGVCGACGAPYARVIERTNMVYRPNERQEAARSQGLRTALAGMMLEPPTSRTIGWRPTCPCGATSPVVPARVLDPFVGSGTTLRVAQALGLDGVGVDLQPTYVDIAERRLVNGYSELVRQEGAVEIRQRDLFSFAEGGE